jgi:cell division protein FtsN
MLLVGLVVGASGSAFYSGIRSGEPGRLGSGLKQWLEVPREDAELAPQRMPDMEPARTTFDFFTVLPEIERVIPDGVVREKTATEPGKASRVVTIAAPERPSGYYMLQAASYDQQAEADRMKVQLAEAGFSPSIQHISIQGQGDFYRVRIGPFFSMSELESANRQLGSIGIQALRLKVSRP